jgi:hypothetical protein
MRGVIVGLTMGFLLVHVMAAGAPTGGAALDRSLQDRPDEQLGPQIHIVYATPSDGLDRAFDTSGQIANAIVTMNGWFSQHGEGASLRVDTFAGASDISFVRLGRTGEQVAASDPWGSIVVELRARGFLDTSKLYAVYYDGESIAGTAGYCGQGSPRVAVIYLGECNWFQAALRSDALELAMLHEILHALDVVPACAPHYSGGHVTEDNRDLMYSGGQDGPKDWTNMTLDPGRDDYFGTSIPGCPDLAESDFLTTRPFYRLTVAAGTGGTISALGRVCAQGQACSFVVRGGTEVTLVASPGRRHRLAGWSRSCGRATTCRLTVGSNTSVAATFNRLYRLKLSATGPGLVRLSPGGKTCRGGRTCVFDVVARTPLSLRAVPGRGARFVRWRGGACAGKPTCVVRLSANTALAATFSR